MHFVHVWQYYCPLAILIHHKAAPVCLLLGRGQVVRAELRSRVGMHPKIEETMAAGDLRFPGEGILIGDKLYSEVWLTIDYCLLPPERLQKSPSAEHGLSADTEEQLRMRGCDMIQAAGILLRLPQVSS